MESGEKLKRIRNYLKLNQEEFGRQLGITKSSVSRMENGTINLTDQMAKLISKTFNVDYFWLTEGKGEMFVKLPSSMLDSLADRYKLSDKGKIILKAYMEAPEEQQTAIEAFLTDIAERIKKESQ